jgi:hypothetical protein
VIKGTGFGESVTTSATEEEEEEEEPVFPQFAIIIRLTITLTMPPVCATRLILIDRGIPHAQV